MAGVLREKAYEESKIVVVLRGKIRVCQFEVLYGSVLYVAEQATIFLIVDSKAVDGVVLPVELSGERIVAGANGTEAASFAHVEVVH